MFTPAQISQNYISVAKAKTSLVWYKALILAVLAGVFIAFGAAVATFASAGLSGSSAAVVKGAVFPVGLILVVVCGAELFTGNCLLIAPAISRDIRVRGLLKNLGIVYIGNLVGGVLIAVILVYSHAMNAEVAAAAVAATEAKCGMGFGDALLRGVLCNMLVCLAVWASMASTSVPGKILAVYLPVFAFVACGFEHSVANMYYLTAGLLTGAEYGIAAEMTLGSALVNCLIPSTLGNIIGGAAIAIAYFAVYRFSRKSVAADVKTPDAADAPQDVNADGALQNENKKPE